MNYSIQQILTFFQENDDITIRQLDENDPKTPSFRCEKNQILLKIEELKQQNQLLKDQCQQGMMAFSVKLNETSKMQTSIATVQQKLQFSIKQTQLLTQEYLKKHEKCFALRQQVINTKKMKRLNDDIGKRIPTCPSETSTVASPSFVIPSTPKLVKLNCRSFTKNF